MPRLVAVLSLLLMVACSSSAPPAQHRASPSPAVSAAGSSPSPSGLAPPGPLSFSVHALATGLTAPWALAFGADGTIWFTERPGRVRIIRNRQLLPTPALTLSVAQQPGCEGGLLGIAVKEPYVYLFYTYAGASGNVNRIARFTISGDSLMAQKVLLDGIPGGSCYHDGGRLKIGPDGLLYATTGETFNASLAASPTGLNGKVLALGLDGSGEHVLAWGFRNPQGVAWDRAGRIYVSNNGPTGDLGLCCHDSIFYVQPGRFYGWPWWAGLVRTSYAGPVPAGRVPPILESDDTVWAPSGMTFFAPPGQQASLLFAELAGKAIRRVIIDPANPSHVLSSAIVFSGYGRMREVAAGPDGCVYALTSNRDGRGSPTAADDQVLQLCPR
jgi:aldose sugar dehydrogenase